MNLFSKNGQGDPAPTGGALLTVNGVSKHFLNKRQNTVALDNISLEAKQGEFVVLVGPSGCGKSTLLNVIAGLDPADEGRVVFDGRTVTKPGPERVVVFQDAALYPWLNVRANIEL